MGVLKQSGQGFTQGANAGFDQKVTFLVADARTLPMLQDERFDAVLGERGCGARCAGGCGNSSKLTRLLQPCRSDVPIQ